MPIFRIVYIDDDTFTPRCLTAEFPDRAAAEIAMARHGHRVVHLAALAAAESAADPIRIAISDASAPHEIAIAPARERAPRRFAFRRDDLAGAAVAVAGLAAFGAAIFLF